MTDDRNDDGKLPDEDELLAELEEWDQTFDSLHEPDNPHLETLGLKTSKSAGDQPIAERAPFETAAPPPPVKSADPFLDDDLAADDLFDFQGEPEALGDLLGPPPLLPPEPEKDNDQGSLVEEISLDAEPADEEVFTSARRPTLEPAPTDEELFGGLPEAVPSVPAHQRKVVARSGPAIVRREDLERKRREREQGGDYVEEATRIADAGILDNIVEKEAEAAAAAAAAAEAFFSEDSAAVELELDDDFYADIEIEGHGEEPDVAQPSLAAEEPAPSAEPAAPFSTGRRVTAHIVRRAASSAEISLPRGPAGDDQGLVVEIEAEPSGEFDLPDYGVKEPSVEVSGELMMDAPSDQDAPMAIAEGALIDDGLPASSEGVIPELLSFDDEVATADRPGEVVPIDLDRAETAPVAPTPVASVVEPALEPELDPHLFDAEPIDVAELSGPARAADDVEVAELGLDDFIDRDHPAAQIPGDDAIALDLGVAPIDDEDDLDAVVAAVSTPVAAQLPQLEEEPLDEAAQLPQLEEEPLDEAAQLPQLEEEPQLLAEQPQLLAEQPLTLEPEEEEIALPPAIVPLDIVDSGAAVAVVSDQDSAGVEAAAPEAIAEAAVPEAPASKFGATGPDVGLDLAALDLPEQVEPAIEDRSEELARQLLLYERELELLDEAAPMARLHLEAGRLSERLGDLDHARTQYEAALVADPRLVAALRALRRVERASAQWERAIGTLDAELPFAAESLRHSLAAHRVDLLMASGEQDLARVAVGELLDESPTDVRALLANLELCYVDGREDELNQSLERLASAIEEPELKSTIHQIRGRLFERGEQSELATQAYQAAVAALPSSRPALRGLARVAMRQGARVESAGALDQAAAATNLHECDAAYAAAIEWRRSLMLEDETARWEALNRAAGLAKDNPTALGALASACERRGDYAAATQVLLSMASNAASPADAAAAYRRAARHLAGPVGAPADAAEALRRVAEIDAGDAKAAADLEVALIAAGDVDALVELDRRAVDADPAGAVYERARMATRLAVAERTDEAITLLEQTPGVAEADGAPVLLDLLSRLYAIGERYQSRAELLARIAEREPDYVAPGVAYRRAARAAEELAYLTISHDESEPPPLDDEHATARAAARDRVLADAVTAWQKVLDLEPDAPAAHAAMVRLAELRGDPERLERALAASQTARREAAGIVGLALRRVALLWAQVDASGGMTAAAAQERGEEILREAQSLADGPRAALPLLLAAAGQGRWSDAAQVLAERAGTLGTTDEAQRLRFRAAAMLLDRGDEPAQAVELLTPVVEAIPQFAAAGDLIESAHRRIGDATALAADLDRAAAPDLQGAGGDSFALLVREAELFEFQVGDAAKAVDLYAEALKLRPADPLARDGFIRAATAAGEAAPVAELALQDLKHAEEAGDNAAKAAAYEELARIDEELRGDAGSALLAWESAAAVEPTRQITLRVLERTYLRDQRWEDLLALYGKQIAAAAPADGVALTLARARLVELLDRPGSEALAEYQHAHELDAGCRMALFRLEAQVRLHGPADQLPALEDAIAEYFEGDARARAAFLTRAGESLADLGEIDASIERFRVAEVLVPGYFPALSAWRRTAAQGQLWLDVATAAQREAELALSDTDRVVLNHLAGVALMDRAMNGERAAAALRKVLALDPSHGDAFLRLRLLFDEQGEHEDLAQLLSNRLEVETDDHNKVELLQALADIHRNFLDDRDSAKENLRAVLALAPNNLRAIATLSDIAWEQGAWAEAAEALIGRARLERDPEMLKNIFYRLGTIYSDRLPNPQWAVKSFQKVLGYDPNDEGALEQIATLSMKASDWKNALGACERLIKLAKTNEEKVGHLHRVGQIYSSGFQDRQRAERAYRVALDLDPTNPAALRELVRFYQEAGDTRSMRVHLDRVAASMRKRLHERPLDALAFRVLARAMEAREQAKVGGSLATARCAAELAQLVGGAEDDEVRLAAHAAQIRPRVLGLGKTTVDDILFPRLVPSEFRQVFGQLGDRIAKHVGTDLRRYGVGRSERVSKDDPLAQPILEVAEDMGVGAIDIYLSEKQPTILVAEPTNPISLVIGKELVTADQSAALRFIAGRGIKLALSSLAVPARMSHQDFGVLVVALLRLFEPEFSATGVDPEKVSQEQQRLRRLIPSGMLQELRPFALGVASNKFNHKHIWAGILHAGNRAGLLASGSVAAAIEILCKVYGHADLAAAVKNPAVMEMVGFAVSEDHAALRAALGG